MKEFQEESIPRNRIYYLNLCSHNGLGEQVRLLSDYTHLMAFRSALGQA